MSELDIVQSAARVDKAIALTFDDGPSEWTRGVLDALEAVGALATFFVVGRWVDDHPEILRSVAAGRHEIGNHSYSHYPTLADQPNEPAIQEELERGNTAIAKALHSEPPKLMRPPVGRLDERVVKVAAEVGFERIVLWSLSSLDYDDATTADDIVLNVCPCIEPGSIVLFHDGPPPERPSHSCQPTVDALPKILDELAAACYRFLTVSELLGDGDARTSVTIS